MRKIKFRAWFKPLKRMCIVKELTFQRNGNITTITKHSGGTSPNSYELMQFTGLKDKNGKEIFEGDILKGRKGLNPIVEYSEERGMFIVNFQVGYVNFNDELGEEWEVIGNIYENPELLDDANDSVSVPEVENE